MDKAKRELICGLFALMTEILEDAHIFAVHGQSSQRSANVYRQTANRLRLAADTLRTLADAAGLIAATPNTSKLVKRRASERKSVS